MVLPNAGRGKSLTKCLPATQALVRSSTQLWEGRARERREIRLLSNSHERVLLVDLSITEHGTRKEDRNIDNISQPWLRIHLSLSCAPKNVIILPSGGIVSTSLSHLKWYPASCSLPPQLSGVCVLMFNFFHQSIFHLKMIMMSDPPPFLQL